MQVAVVGGAGGMGRVTVADLAQSPDVEEVRIVDVDEKRARELAERLGSPVSIGAAGDLHEALADVDAVVNAASHRLNIPVMQACLEAGAHYTDLGGLFHFALSQYELDEAFRKRGLAAAISMGSAPGLTNMLAAACCERLDTVESIEIADAFISGREPSPTDPYLPPYAASTLIDEFTEPAAVFLEGELRMVPADSGAKVYAFPEGSVECVYTIHSEPATLPRSYAEKGIRNVEWRLGLPPLDVQRLRSFVAAGLTSTGAITIGEAEVVPRDLLAEVLMRQSRTIEPQPDPEAVEWFRVIASGAREGLDTTLVAEIRVGERPEWESGAGAMVTGTPPSIAVQLLCGGARLRDGVGGPEVMLPAGRFFVELARRRMTGVLRDGDEEVALHDL